MESINWLPFPDTMELTAYMIENDKNLLPSLLILFEIYKIKRWWNTREDDLKQTAVKVATRCSNRGK